jgi:hypothetical protein
MANSTLETNEINSDFAASEGNKKNRLHSIIQDFSDVRELNRRAKGIKDGTEKLVSWDDAMATLKERDLI